MTRTKKRGPLPYKASLVIPTRPARPFASSAGSVALERVVEGLADGYKWNWSRMMSHRDAADCVLDTLAKLGLIEQIEHPLGGTVWRVGKRLFGRTDGITSRRFTAIMRKP